MRLAFSIRDLIVASWSVEQEDAVRLLPTGLEPAEIDGTHLVSVVAMRYASPPWHCQINVRTYVRHEAADAVYFLLARVTPPGLAGLLLGAPVGPSRISVERGAVDAPGLGYRLHYRVGEPAEAGPIGRHELGIFGRRRFRALHIVRSPTTWHEASLIAPVRADPILHLGIALTEPFSLLYAASTELEVRSRPRRLRLSVRSGKIRDGTTV